MVQRFNFLNGIAGRRHHFQIRNHPRTMFFNGLNCTKKHTAAPLGASKLRDQEFLVQQMARASQTVF